MSEDGTRSTQEFRDAFGAEQIEIRPALPDEAPVLTALALRSKAHWGYSEDFMKACVDELTVLPRHIKNDTHHHGVAVERGVVIGFYTLEGQVREAIELGALFVSPGHMGRGVGKRLLLEAKRQARVLGGTVLTIQGDPKADRFYRAMGAEWVSDTPSGSIAGRMLPSYRIRLIPDA